MSYKAIKETDWIDFTPACSLTNLTAITGKYKRHGSNMEFIGHVVISSSTSFAAGAWIDPLGPLGLTVGSSYLLGFSGSFNGETLYWDITAQRYKGQASVLISWESPQKIYFQTIGTNGLATTITSTTPFTWADGDRLFIHVKYLPIAEWGG